MSYIEKVVQYNQSVVSPFLSNGMMNISRRNLLKNLTRFGVLAAFVYPTLLEPNMPVIENIKLKIHNIPKRLKGLKIGLVGDLHSGLFFSKSDAWRAFNKLSEIKTDVLFLVGDYVYQRADNIYDCIDAITSIKTGLGTYAVLGNHDYWTDSEIVCTCFKEKNIHVLINQSVKVSWNGETFFITGLDDVWAGCPNIRKALSGVPESAMKFLLVHEPDYADQIINVRSWLPVQFSGHSHGGQFVVPFINKPIYTPYLSKKYPIGLNRISMTDRWLYTTRGIGQTIPFRLNCRPEISVITLV